MLFNSIQFVLFFQIVLAAYFTLPHRFRWAWLLLASCYFYMVFVPAYVLILFALILIDYTTGLVLEKTVGSRKKMVLLISLCTNIGFLGFFKYFNFVNENLAALCRLIHWNYGIESLAIALPIGLSFHTFQSMSYTIEVYRGKQKAEHHLGIYSLYVMFFPQLVAGPIERPQNLLHQLHARHDFDEGRFFEGLQMMLWGYFKKWVIADRLALIVNHVYAAPAAHSSVDLILATYCFAYQIYCDFAGYSEIARGAARIMGIDLMQNFDRPYSAQSISEFWKRWHMSLSMWFRDYLYIPLGGNRATRPRWYFNLFVTFLVSGLWHGAAWSYMFWGALHGFYLILSIVTAPLRAAAARSTGIDRRPTLKKWVNVAITFNLAAFAWIAFRARSLPETLLIMRKVLSPLTTFRSPLDLGVGPRELAVGICAIVFMEFVEANSYQPQAVSSVAPGARRRRWVLSAAAVALIVLFGKMNPQRFIYFQF